jgi:hypothetical protein
VNQDKVMQTTSRRDWNQLIILFLILTACVMAIAGLQVPQLQWLKTRSDRVSVTEIRRDIEAETLRLTLLEKLPSLGFDNLIADWTFLNFLQYFGDETARRKTDYRLSPTYFDVILGHDPAFVQAYTFLSTSAALYAGQPEKSTAIMKKSLEALNPVAPPGSYYAWRQLGIDQLLFLGDAGAARQSFATAAQWATIQGNSEVAYLSQQTANFLAKNPNSKVAQASAWVMVLMSAPDDRTRKTAIEKVEALGGKILPNPDGSYRIQLPTKD